MEFIKALAHKEKFNPGLIGLVFNPFFFARKGLYRAIASLSGNIKGKTLDIGCGSKPYQNLFVSSTEYVGLEIDTPESREKNQADYFYDGSAFPFDDSEFDSAVANQVFEHVFNPEEFLEEINRILKPQGTLLLSVPFVWDEHEQPYDYARYSSFGIKHLFEKHGFEIVEHIKSINDARVIFQLINCYTYKKALPQNVILKALFAFILIFPINLLGSVFSIILPKNNDLYLDNVIVARKTDNA